MAIEPFKIKIDQPILDDLQKRLRRTRWTEEEEDNGWNHGTNLAYLKEFVQYWLTEYNWRKAEARLNTYSWFRATVEGNPIRFIHEKGKGPNAVPILLLHGWPDSVMRYLKVLPMLTEPVEFGGKANESFDVVIPSYIGGFADSPVPLSSHELKDLAENCWQLMTRQLGYEKFLIAGGDGGSPIAQIMATLHPDSVLGLHLTDIGWHTNRRERSGLTEEEQNYLQGLEYNGFSEGAYAMVQGTKPQTLGLALNDSPVGMAGWILEKFSSWSDCDGGLENMFTKDELITNIMFYWLENSTKAFSYREEFVSPSIAPDQRVEAPVALAFPPKDRVGAPPPKSFAARNLKNIRQWNMLERGGHFVAMEYPELLVKDVRSFVATLK